MKKLISVIAMLLIIFSVTPVFASNILIEPDDITPYIGENLIITNSNTQYLYSTYGIYLRTSPEYSSSNKICLIKRGTRVVEVSKYNNSWYQIRYNGKTGYAPAKYLSRTEQGVIYVQTTTALKLRKEANADSSAILTMPKGATVRLVKKVSNSWYQVNYNGTVGYTKSKYLTSIQYPLVYSDGSMTVTIDRTWYKHAYVYTAHIQTTNYKRFGMHSAYGKWNRFCTPYTAYKQLNAIVIINGDYSSCYSAAYASGGDDYGTGIARRGKVLHDEGWYGIGLYNNKTGKLFNSHGVSGYHGKSITELVNAGKATDTFNFFWCRPVFQGQNQVSATQKNSTDRRPRTFIGTNGKPGDIWLCVADGDYRDGKSIGLNGWERAQFLIDHCHCTFGVGLDGGGSSAFIYNGFRLTGGSKERSVCDFGFIR